MRRAGDGLWWSGLADDLLTVVVNRSDAPLKGRLIADKAYELDGQAPGTVRRIAHHPLGEGSYRVEGDFAGTGTEGPYHGGPVDLAEDGPDAESIVLFTPGGVQVWDVDRLQAEERYDVLSSAGYEPDRRVPASSGEVAALVRVGPSLDAGRASRVIVLTPTDVPRQGATVFQGTDVRDLKVAWSPGGELLIRAKAAGSYWAHPFAIVALSDRFALQRVKVEVGDAKRVKSP